MEPTITGAFPDPAHVDAAVQGLLEEHFESQDLRILLLTKDGQTREVPVRHRMEMGRGAVVGGILGVVVGAVLTPLVASGVIDVVHGGLVAESVGVAAVQGAVMGAMLGSLTGLIVGMAIWRTVVDVSPADWERGEVLVGAAARGRGIDRVRRVFEDAGATRISVDDRALPRSSSVRLRE